MNTETDIKNRETERQEIQHLQTAPEKVFLYVHMPQQASPIQSFAWASGDYLRACCKVALAMQGSACPICHRSSDQMIIDASKRIDVQTWLGTPVATHVWIGPRRYMGFNQAYRRPMSCRLYGVLYHGWFYESSGDYCRLTKAKRQVTR